MTSQREPTTQRESDRCPCCGVLRSAIAAGAPCPDAATQPHNPPDGLRAALLRRIAWCGADHDRDIDLALAATPASSEPEVLRCLDRACGHLRDQHSNDRADDFACDVPNCPCSGWDDELDEGDGWRAEVVTSPAPSDGLREALEPARLALEAMKEAYGNGVLHRQALTGLAAIDALLSAPVQGLDAAWAAAEAALPTGWHLQGSSIEYHADRGYSALVHAHDYGHSLTEPYHAQGYGEGPTGPAAYASALQALAAYLADQPKGAD